MGTRSTGRGTAAIFGLLVLLAGLIGAGVLFNTSQQRPEQAIDGYARAAVGCSTTLRFVDTGTFYVFEERGPSPASDLEECPPAADPERAFGFVLSDQNGPIEGQGDLSLSYDTGDRTGQSVASFEVDAPGEFTIDVFGGDVDVVAAIGQDPDDGVSDLRRSAAIVGGVGVALGGLLLLLAGRRSKRAATVATPEAGRVWNREPELVDDRQAVPHVPLAGQPTAVDDASGPTWPPLPPSVSEPATETAPPEPGSSPIPTLPSPFTDPATPIQPNPPMPAAPAPPNNWAPPTPGQEPGRAVPPPPGDEA